MINPDFEGERLKDKYQSPSPTGLPVEEPSSRPDKGPFQPSWKRRIRRIREKLLGEN